MIGSGAVAQVQHLPNLAALKDLYPVEMVCDLSPSQARIVAEEYHVPHHTGDWRELLAHDLDAVILCHTDPKTEIAVAAFEAGNIYFGGGRNSEADAHYSRALETNPSYAEAYSNLGVVRYT